MQRVVRSHTVWSSKKESTFEASSWELCREVSHHPRGGICFVKIFTTPTLLKVFSWHVAIWGSIIDVREIGVINDFWLQRKDCSSRCQLDVDRPSLCLMKKYFKVSPRCFRMISLEVNRQMETSVEYCRWQSASIMSHQVDWWRPAEL